MYTKQRKKKKKEGKTTPEGGLCGETIPMLLTGVIVPFIEIHKQVSKLERTLSCPESPPLTISGAMYSIVPQKEYALSALNNPTKRDRTQMHDQIPSHENVKNRL